MNQSTHCTGKTGKMAKKKSCNGKHREFGNVVKTNVKTQGILFAQVINSLILKDSKEYCDICRNFFLFFQKPDYLASQCVYESRKLTQGKFAVGQGINRENTI